MAGDPKPCPVCGSCYCHDMTHYIIQSNQQPMWYITGDWVREPQFGWICPRCLRVNAPDVKQCTCEPKEADENRTYRTFEEYHNACLPETDDEKFRRMCDELNRGEITPAEFGKRWAEWMAKRIAQQPPADGAGG